MRARAEAVGQAFVDLAGCVRGGSDGDGREVEAAVEPGVTLVGVAIVAQAGSKLDGVVAMAERGDVLKLEGEPVIFGVLAGESAADKIAGDTDGASGGVGVVIFVVALKLKAALVDEVIVEDGGAGELDGVVGVGLVGGAGSESAGAGVEIAFFVFVPEAVARRHGGALAHLPVEARRGVVANVRA